jgi:hypothetical protein
LVCEQHFNHLIPYVLIMYKNEENLTKIHAPD